MEGRTDKTDGRPPFGWLPLAQMQLLSLFRKVPASRQPKGLAAWLGLPRAPAHTGRPGVSNEADLRRAPNRAAAHGCCTVEL